MINNFTESIVGITVTATGAVTDADHPTIDYGSSNVTITCAVGAASASGLQASISTASSVTIACNLGTAAASGNAATLTQSVTIVCSLGTATAQGHTAGLVDVFIYNTADRGTVNLSLSSVTPNGLTSTVFVRNRWFTGDNSAGARSCFFHVTGVNGKTPVFDIDRSNMEISNATNKFLWSYTGAMGTWNAFTNTTRESSPNVYRVSNATAFAQDTVYVSMQYPWPVGYTLPWITTLEATGHVSYPPSGSGTYLYGTRTATTNGSTAGVGDVIPAQPLYGFRVGTTGNAPSGLPKKKMVLMSGLHASEDVGNYALKGAVDFLCSSDPAAVSVRDWFEIFVYPVIAAAGRAGGHMRGDFENAFKAQDVNRAFDNSPTMEAVTKIKAAIQSDAGSTVDVFFDFHGTHLEANHFGQVDTATNLVKFRNALQAHRPGITVNEWTTNENTAWWARTSKSCTFPLTPESPYHITLSLSEVEDFGADNMRAVSTLIAQGEFGVATISCNAGNAQAAGYTAAVSVGGATTIVCNVGQAVAAGQLASIATNAAIGCAIGNATAAGFTGTISQGFTVIATTGQATAQGHAASVIASGPVTITCTIGVSAATGLTATITSTASLSDSEKIDLILDILSNRQLLDATSGLYTLYADDGVTVLKTALAWEDTAGTIPYRGQGLKRLDAMI
jgi:predicted deacylase